MEAFGGYLNIEHRNEIGLTNFFFFNSSQKLILHPHKNFNWAFLQYHLSHTYSYELLRTSDTYAKLYSSFAFDSLGIVLSRQISLRLPLFPTYQLSVVIPTSRPSLPQDYSPHHPPDRHQASLCYHLCHSKGGNNKWTNSCNLRLPHCGEKKRDIDEEVFH